MAEFQVYQDAAKNLRGVASWSFRIDGQESLHWSMTEAGARRIARRLQQGRSGEAFPNPVVRTNHEQKPRGKVVAAGEVTVETVVMKSGREKARAKHPGFVAELDGKALKGVHASEAEARAACAVQAYLTRGKLGRFAEAEAAFEEEHGMRCKVQVLKVTTTGATADGVPILGETKDGEPVVARAVVAKDEKGGLWAVKLVKGRDPEFKRVAPAGRGK